MPRNVKPIFAENFLDRMDHLRPLMQDPILLAGTPSNRFILFSGGNVLFRRSNNNFMFTKEDVARFPGDKEQIIFLGGRGQDYYFALSFAGDIGVDVDTIDLKSLVTQNLLPDTELGMLAEASSVLKWHLSHKFCGCCGSETKSMHAGWRRDCTPCGTLHFPRIDPVVIMLVTHQDACLLGSGRHFEDQRNYSCLAGFMEPGETIEEAAKRELFEEAGVIARHIEYMCSQPWPFPSSLMIGLCVEADSKDIKMDEKELRDIKWVSKADIAAALNGATDRGFHLPPRVAVARTLLEVWTSRPK